MARHLATLWRLCSAAQASTSAAATAGTGWLSATTAWAVPAAASSTAGLGLSQQLTALRWSSSLAQEFVSLNNLADNPGATHSVKRVGRGIGSGLGKTSGRGHKGQKARTGRTPKLGFEGGQTPLRLRVPKRGFHNPNEKEWALLNLDRLAAWVAAGRLDPGRVITMKDLRDARAVDKKLHDGVKLLANGASSFSLPLHLQVSCCSAAARAAVERAGGSVTTVYYNDLGLRALTQPDWFAKKGRLLPRPARPPPKLAPRFDRIGELPPSTAVPPTAPKVVAGSAT